MSQSPDARRDSAGEARVIDHAFYLWDDTDEHTRTLCDIGCGYGPEDHMSPPKVPAAPGDAERVR